VIEATRAALRAEQIAFLYGLPPTVQIADTHFCHATPRNDVDIFTERTPEVRIAHLFADVDADVVVCGHTHTQFERMIVGKRVINSGSVGMPYEDAPRGLLDARPRTSPHGVRRGGAAEDRARGSGLALGEPCRRRLSWFGSACRGDREATDQSGSGQEDEAERVLAVCRCGDGHVELVASLADLSRPGREAAWVESADT
jgi:hypothetical protein